MKYQLYYRVRPNTTKVQLEQAMEPVFKSGRDKLVKVYEGAIFADLGIMAMMDEVWGLHNGDTRPYTPLMERSMSIGDVVVFGETAFTVTERGYPNIALTEDDIIDTKEEEKA